MYLINFEFKIYQMDYSKEFKKYATKHHGVSSTYYDKIISSMTPYIIEERQLNVAQMDVFSRLMMDRIMFLGTAITDSVANVIQAQLLFLQSTDSSRDIQMYINSPGGVVTSGLSIYDTMEYIKPDVCTVCFGQAASMGSLLLTAGSKNKRFCLPNSRIMTHQPSGGFQGQAADIEIHAKEIMNLRSRLNQIYVKHSGKKLADIESLMDRDTFISPEDAVKLGLIDKVVNKRDEVNK